MLARTALRTARVQARALSTVASKNTSPTLLAGVAAVTLLAGGVALNEKQKVNAHHPNAEHAILEKLSGIEKTLAKMGKDGSNKMTLDQILAAKVANPDMIMGKHFDLAYYLTLPDTLKDRLLQCCKSGAENQDSGMGVYAMYPDDYDVLGDYMDKVIRDYHKIPGKVNHVTNWDLSTVGDRLPPGGKLDLTKLGLGETSMRVRVGRNLGAFPLPGAMSREDRVNMEGFMVKAFKELIEDPAFGGNYYSLTPGSPFEVSDKFYQHLVKSHIMFKDMGADTYLTSAGISSNWPAGRGVYVSADKQFIVWVGEEDHLRIMCMKRGTVLNEVFDRLKIASDKMESICGNFARSKNYGFVTSCPTNLGTGMRASVHIKIPKLTRGGSDAKAKAVCKPLGLSVRGMGGEHTPIGSDGTVDISPSARLQIQEAEIICALYEGIRNLKQEEDKL